MSFGPDEDGLDWNVTRNGWTWPIDRAELRLHGLDGLVWNNVRVFTGPQGNRAGDARIIARAPGFLDVVATGPLSLHEGLTQRLYGVLDKRLGKVEFAGGDISIADFAILGWAWLREHPQIDLARFPNVRRWYGTLMARLGLQLGFAVALS